jgi:hypothetical protein
MRRFTILLGFACLLASLHATTLITVAQLEQFLTSKQASKRSDAEIADRLKSVRLTEQLTAQAFVRIKSETDLGPSTTEQLRLIGASSIFFAPPSDELPARAAPDPVSQKRMIDSSVAFVDTILHRLPDFISIRTTDSLDNTPESAGPKRAKPKAELHFVRQTRREIAYRNGQELSDSVSGGSQNSVVPGLTTWGEFGPILKTVLRDSFKGSVARSRWQMSEAGALVAVFSYRVPKSASHYLIDSCCFQKSRDDPQSFPFRDKPGYHGELFLDPTTGAIDRVTLEAELTEDDPVMVSGIAVQYGRVTIAGKDYVCPIRGIAISKVHNLAMELIDKVGPEEHLNQVSFTNYHKFGSTAHILTGSSDARP